jgi:hypothetical protein
VQTQEYRYSWAFDRVFVPNESLILRWQARATRTLTRRPLLPGRIIQVERTRLKPTFEW